MTGFWTATALIIAGIALVRTIRQRKELELLRARLTRALVELDTARSGETAPDDKAVIAAEKKSIEDRRQVPAHLGIPTPPTKDANDPDKEVEDAVAAAPALPKPRPIPTAPKKPRRLEERLASNWLVWLGGLALACAGYFLVMYAVERGLLGPRGRIIAGTIMGVSLIGLGEFIRRLPTQKRIAAIKADYIPQALTSGGLATLFGCAYAAHHFYSLIGAPVAFTLLTVIAIGAFGLSLVQGPFVAILGLLGSFSAPALIPSGDPTAAKLFGYLFIVSTACAAISYCRPWTWLNVGALVGCLLWTALWFNQSLGPGDATVIGVFWILLATGHLILTGLKEGLADRQQELLKGSLPRLDIMAWAASIIAVGVHQTLAVQEHFSNASLGIALGYLALLLCHVIWRPRFEGLLALVCATTLLLFSLWLGAGHEHRLWKFDAPESQRLIYWMIGLIASWLVTMPLLSRVATRPSLWAIMIVTVPTLLLGAAYRLAPGIATKEAWSISAVVLAAGLLAILGTVPRRGNARDQKLWIGILALGVTAAISLALVFGLSGDWITVALALQLPAIGWVAHRFDLPILRPAALIIAGICSWRLVFHLGHPWHGRSVEQLDQQILYVYGVPLVAFHVAFLLFKCHKDDVLVKFLEGGRLLFFVLLLGGEIRLLTQGMLDRPGRGLLESGLNASTWLTLAWSRWRAHGITGRFIDKTSAELLTLIAMLLSIFGPLVIFNPAVQSVTVGPWFLLNALGVGYLLPAILTALVIGTDSSAGKGALTQVTLGVSVALFWAWLTFQTRHVFQGSVMAPNPSDPENYTYSAVWLLASFGLLFAAIKFRYRGLRYASLALTLLTVAKVFLFDMRGLEGLLRVASFLGLGLSLVAIGFIYQRFVFADAPSRTSPTP